MSRDTTEIAAAKRDAIVNLLASRHRGPLQRILVVGCGTGLEAGILARGLGAETIGIDVGAEFAFDHEGSQPAVLMPMDAQRLEFEDAAFDVVYSFHALEHIPDHRKALSEMSRVLRPGGTFCVGTPNKARLVGYLGSADPLRCKVRWNLNDLSMRLRGRWSNEKGAHAGFYADELRELCAENFGQASEITDDYYLTLYDGRRELIRRITSSRLKYLIFPCVYFAGQRVTTGA
ncbi:MAG: class I SAM-dependent methyltransferase [Mycobacterium sp.]|uniref:class I SAM-dependent methyltransferase n=1 Tax=Mycobacterium sp. TaxID=1785 RepID=UPI001ECD5DB0|nr:class I SAM-dependent methyltransferase [Mycobacterium sp.]MBW0017012.1 class I SAM-dependent methyltransferase [Mycobacterium sp.]